MQRYSLTLESPFLRKVGRSETLRKEHLKLVLGLPLFNLTCEAERLAQLEMVGRMLPVWVSFES